MASLTDIIAQQVLASTGNIQIPSDIKKNVLGGLSDSILGSLTQTATKPGGLDLVKSLLTGKTAAEASPITALAGKLFTNNILSKLNLNNVLKGSLLAAIPLVFSKMSGILKDQDGDGDVDLNDILITLKGGGQKQQSAAGSILGNVGKSILGSILGKK
ncbi:MAG: hypothetical protein IK119_04275 [Bacteroidales bacterium]|jgi:hypothetical protein|nr:hypothetical protein [Bacteroidales bacterium]MBR3285971.1 hypothetical protein [Bacteroidales bacterium]MBR5431580.1 hypothetical protein [Bacteroidales bacterium]